MVSEKRLLREADVAERLDLAVATLRKWRFFGHGPAWVKLGGAVRYDPQECERWIASQPGGGERTAAAG